MYVERIALLVDEFHEACLHHFCIVLPCPFLYLTEA